jgi:hypothetical protein
VGGVRWLLLREIEAILRVWRLQFGSVPAAGGNSKRLIGALGVSAG